MTRSVPGHRETCDRGYPPTPSRATGTHGVRRYRVPRDAQPATSLTEQGLTYRAGTETPRLCRVDLPPSDGLESHAPFSGCAGQPDPERGWGNLAGYGEEDVIDGTHVIP